MSQGELADRAKVNLRYLSRVETTDCNLGLDFMDAVAKALSVPLAALVEDVRDEPAAIQKARAEIDELIERLKKLKAMLPKGEA